MTLRKGHGAGAGVPRIEVLPADELPVGVPVSKPSPQPGERDDKGRFRPGNPQAARGGRAKAKQTALANKLGLAKLTTDAAFAPYKRAAASFATRQCGELASTVGGGVCGPAPASLVRSAALQLAASRYLSDQAAESGAPELFVTASRLANDSRQNLLAAHELAAKEAKARELAAPADDPWFVKPSGGAQ